MPAIEMTNPAALPADWRDLLALTKPRVMSLVVFTGLCGLLAAPELPPLVLGFTAILCIALGAGACGALNQWYEADIDAKMRRTAKRPLPAGRMERQTALHFGVGLGVFSVLLMGLATNWLAAGAAGGIDPVLRARLHRVAEAADRAEHRHRRSGRRVPAADRLGRRDGPDRGAAADAVRDHFPVDPAAFLGAVAVRPLGLCRRRESRCCRWWRGSQNTRRQIFLYSLPMAAAAVAPWLLGLTGPVYGICAAILSLVFVVLAGRVLANRATAPAEMGAEKHLFAYSVFYLFALFTALVADRWIAW